MLRLIRTRPFLRLRPQLAQLARHYSIPPTQFQKDDVLNPSKPPKPSRSRWKVGTAVALILAVTAFMVLEVEPCTEHLQEQVQHYKKALETADPKETFDLQSRLAVAYFRLNNYQAAFDQCVELYASPNTPLDERPNVIFCVLVLATKIRGVDEEGKKFEYPKTQVMDNLRQATQLAHKEIIRQYPEAAELFREDISDKELSEVATKLREKGDFKARKHFRELVRVRDVLSGMMQKTDIDKALEELKRTYWIKVASGAEKPELVSTMGVYYMICCNRIIGRKRFGPQTPEAYISNLMLQDENKRLLDDLLKEIASATPEERDSKKFKIGEACGKIGLAMGELREGRFEQGKEKLVEARALADAGGEDGIVRWVDSYVSVFLAKRDKYYCT